MESILQSNALSRFKDWVEGFDSFPPGYGVDFAGEVPGTGGIFPKGLEELERREDILGGVRIWCRYNFLLYRSFPLYDSGDAAAQNAAWVLGFQKWVQAQSAAGLTPVFGNRDTGSERIRAEKGALVSRPESGTGLYCVQVKCDFIQQYGG